MPEIFFPNYLKSEHISHRIVTASEKTKGIGK